MGENNYVGYYFIKESYLNLDVCKKLNDSEYMFYINKTFNCTWLHCINNSYNGYNIEHIIPINNNISDILGCDMNISGNLVMAYNAWIHELDNNFFYERLLIYNEIYINAYQAVYWCCKQHQLPAPTRIPALNCVPTLPPFTIPTKPPISTNWAIYLFIPLIICVIIVCVMGLCDAVCL